MMSQPQVMKDPGQAQRLRKARRTALIVAAFAVAFFLFSILQMVWLQHAGPAH